ncbi:unnamed protein product, partial [Effrenium voratum]
MLSLLQLVFHAELWLGFAEVCSTDCDTNLLQVGLNLDARSPLESATDADTARTRTRAAASLKRGEAKSQDCPPSFPGCTGQLLDVCSVSSTSFLRLGHSSGELMLDVTNALTPRTRVQVLVMAMFKTGGYADDLGYVAERASPAENTQSLLLELEVSSDGTTVDVYKPIMDIRTSDPQSLYAVERGLGNTLQESLPRFNCVDNESRIIVEAQRLLGSGFFVVNTAQLGPEHTVVHAKEYQKNFDITADYGPQLPLLRVGYTVVLLPDEPMQIRKNDDRLLYFDTQFHDIGSHPKLASETRSQSVDKDRSMIWRYNVNRDKTLRFYVDPSVPKRWRPYFRKGIELWNDAFTLIERPNAVQAVLPEDADWPSDYDISDARFSTVTWDLASSTFSMGIAKVDPRSGEIIKSDVCMGDSWVKAYLQDLEMQVVNVTAFARTAVTRAKSSLLSKDASRTRSDAKQLHQSRSPTVGAYDKLAIKYGYTHFTSPPEEAAPILQETLREAESYQYCADTDNSYGEDPSCIDYDLSSDPIGYWEGQISLFAQVQKNLLDRTVPLKQSYELYGYGVDLVLSSYVPEIGFRAIQYLGGMNNSYLHRYEDQQGRPSSVMAGALQRRALEVALRILRPANEQLLPPEENLPFLVESHSSDGSIVSLDVNDLMRRTRQLILEELLGYDRLQKVHRQERMSTDSDAFTVAELLSSTVYNVFGAGLDNVTSEDERDLQRQFMDVFTSSLPAVRSAESDIMMQLQYTRRFLQQMLEVAEQRLGTDPGWRSCAGFNETCACEAEEKQAKSASCECLALHATETQKQRLFVESLQSMGSYTAEIVREAVQEKIQLHRPGRVVELTNGELMLRPYAVMEQGEQVMETELLKVDTDAPIRFRSPMVRRLLTTFQGRDVPKMTVKELESEVDRLYTAKISADSEADAANMPRADLAAFMVEHYLEQRGTVTGAQERVVSILSCIRTLDRNGQLAPMPLKVLLFARFLQFCNFTEVLALPMLNVALQARRLAHAASGRK